MPVPEEFSRRRRADELQCLTPEAIQQFHPRPLHELAAELGAQRASQARAAAGAAESPRATATPPAGLGCLAGRWGTTGRAQGSEPGEREHGPRIGQALVLEAGPGISVPTLLLVPPSRPGTRAPVVVAVASEGKQAFLDQRSESIAEWLGGGAAVCLIDVRGTGETKPRDGSRRHHGALRRVFRRRVDAGTDLGRVAIAGPPRYCATCAAVPISTPAGLPSGATRSRLRTQEARTWLCHWRLIRSPIWPSRWEGCWPTSAPCLRTMFAPFTCGEVYRVSTRCYRARSVIFPTTPSSPVR